MTGKHAVAILRQTLLLILLMSNPLAVWAVDTDGDGADNSVDAFPTEPEATTDTDGDGKPDSINQANLPILFADSFESGTIGAAWTRNPSGSWSALSGAASDGSYFIWASGSGSAYACHTAIFATCKALTTTVTLSSAGHLYFAVKGNYSDSGIEFYVDGGKWMSYQGINIPDWQAESFPLNAGTHELKWVAMNGSSARLDNVYIKKVTTLTEDTDDDNDGTPDVSDAFPLDPMRTSDVDTTAITTISFESGIPAGWTKPATGNASWLNSGSQASHLSKSLRSGYIGHSATAQIEFVANIANTVFTIDAKTSTEVNDAFRIYVDGVSKLFKSGENNWRTYMISVTPGVHTIRFSYAKNASVTSGLDAVWIDKLVYLDGTDTDADGLINAEDPDDDNDGVPDYLDPEPLNPANATQWPLDGSYKGSTIGDNATIP